MIIEHTSEVVNNTLLSTNDFSILDSPMLYKLMYTSLYEDKEKIVLQELSANALDAHIVAGNEDTPIEIVLPTKLQPELVVRDFGVGMSLETLSSIYTVYGASTKRSDNTAIGGFGLGSKSPFALSDSFIVESTHKGITSTVTCFLDNGMPKFSVFTSESTGKSDGTEIRVPIASEEVQSRLKNKVSSLYLLWPVKPKITSSGTDILADSGVIVENDLYLLPTGKIAYGDRYKMIVAVGPFTYALPTGIVERIEKDSNIREIAEKFKLLRSTLKNEVYRVVPKFAIGELELSPSREVIEPTEKNFKTITEKMLGIERRPFIGAKRKFTVAWYEEFVDICLEKGIRKDTYSASKAFFGIDPTYVKPLFESLLTANPTVFDYAWASERAVRPEELAEQLLKEAPEKVRLLQEKANTFIFGHDYSSVYSTDLRLHADLRSSNFRMVNPQAIVELGLSEILVRYRQHTKSRTNRAQLTYNGRPSISTLPSHLWKDPRTVPVFAGSEGNRQKFYAWWRTFNATLEDTCLIMYENPDDLSADIEWLDENLPIPKAERTDVVYTIDDVNKYWKSRPKQTRKTGTTATGKKVSSSRITKKEEQHLVIGSVSALESTTSVLDVKGLSDILDSKPLAIFVTARMRTRSDCWEARCIPKEVLDRFIILEIPKKFQNRKVVKDLFAKAQASGIDIEFSDNNTSYNIYRSVRKIDLIENLERTAKHNAEIVGVLSPFSISPKKLTSVYGKLLETVKGVDEIPLDANSYRSSPRTLHKLSSLIPQRTLSRMLEVSFNASYGDSIPDIITASDIKALSEAFKQLKENHS